MSDSRIAVVLSDEHTPKARAALGRVLSCPLYVIDRVGRIIYQTAIPPVRALRDLRPYIVVWIGVGDAMARQHGPARSPMGGAPSDRHVGGHWTQVKSQNQVLDAIRAAQAEVQEGEYRQRANAAQVQVEQERELPQSRAEALAAARERERKTIWLFIPAGLG